MDSLRISKREASQFLGRDRRENTRSHLEEGSLFSNNDNLERECLEEKCSLAELNEVYESDKGPQFQKGLYTAAREYLENLHLVEQRSCAEHIHVVDTRHQVDGMYYAVYDYTISAVNTYLKPFIYQHATIPQLALVLCSDDVDQSCKWRFVNTKTQKCTNRCYSTRPGVEFCPSFDFSNFGYPYNNPGSLTLEKVNYVSTSIPCWQSHGTSHQGCKCNHETRVCERQLLLYNTLWNRCDHNCKAASGCNDFKHAFCCSEEQGNTSCPPEMNHHLGSGYKFVYPLYWSEWSPCPDDNKDDCRVCVNSEENNRKCGDNLRRRGEKKTSSHFNADRNSYNYLSNLRNLNEEYLDIPPKSAYVSPLAYTIPIILFVIILCLGIFLVNRFYRRSRVSSIRDNPSQTFERPTGNPFAINERRFSASLPHGGSQDFRLEPVRLPPSFK
ncbi:Oidioi.mRNA.OKI2018_I69.chr2.g7694.t1.cds [Oikopleura dioica]|uniref:Oidioi.mRNA.OKI2018_I69.chr2.g7694.t1.cds n=1 Tax=Oikopleura dioica TaxID=34765 RepID=A0ABN7T812_OIKDI|nr:Oidioi.mRNA.OKI2018_I69.chr2.g7694.t1.cds [Oikopleura dioica]